MTQAGLANLGVAVEGQTGQRYLQTKLRAACHPYLAEGDHGAEHCGPVLTLLLKYPVSASQRSLLGQCFWLKRACCCPMPRRGWAPASDPVVTGGGSDAWEMLAWNGKTTHHHPLLHLQCKHHWLPAPVGTLTDSSQRCGGGHPCCPVWQPWDPAGSVPRVWKDPKGWAHVPDWDLWGVEVGVAAGSLQGWALQLRDHWMEWGSQGAGQTRRGTL